MKIKLITLLLLAYFLKELVWLAIIPIWHFPDEEAHFAQAAFLAEKNRFPEGDEKDVNQEIDSSSEILGTKRDGRGINKFTYHPEYRIPYSKTPIGVYEDKIKSLNNQENRKEMVKHETARYGPIYYLLINIPYKMFYENDLLVRVFSSRLISIILSTITVLITYLIAKEIFRSELYRIGLTFLISFQPMFSFVSAGVNSDNLFNLIFTLILYCCLKIFFNKKNQFLFGNLVFLIMVIIGGFYTKKQIFISVPIICFAFLISILTQRRKMRKYYLLTVGLLIFLFLIMTKGKIRIPEFHPTKSSKLEESFFQYTFWHLKHTIAETIPWYWGVFNWLGVTLPPWVNRVQARILVVVAVGMLVYLFKQIKNKKLFTVNNLKIVFLLGSAAIYYFSIIFWDYFFRQTHSFSFGIQGRYFFPTIVSHMLLIILGLVTLIPKKFKSIFIKIFIIWWLIFSLIGLYTATNAYYQLWPIFTFLNQASQYKPPIFKATGLVIIILSFFMSFFIFLVKFLTLNEKRNF